MTEARFDTKLFDRLKDILLRLHYGELLEDVQMDFKRYFEDVPIVEVLLIAHELKSGDDGITSLDIEKLFLMYKKLSGKRVRDLYESKLQNVGHPVEVFYTENKALLSVADQVSELMEKIASNSSQKLEMFFEESPGDTVREQGNPITVESTAITQKPIDELKNNMLQLGQFFNHFHRKEKLMFPILERYGHFTLTRIMWGDDDQIRNLFKGTKSMIERLPELPFKYVKKSFDLFVRKFKDMIFQEEAFLLPVLCHYFTEEDWLAIAKESDAFGFAVIDPDGKWVNNQEATHAENESIKKVADVEATPIPFGGGYLTIKEANSILNNLPVEITFVDKFGVFKYFNDIVKSSEMMFVRTPSSIGRNVGHCHPPRSMLKVVRLISDLKEKRRTSETMWFKKDGRYVHITYKGLFDENGEYLGILEYVQDIQPFFDLPREVKKEITPLDDE